MSAMLSPCGVTPSMEFVCADCGEVTTGQQVLDGAFVYIVRKNLDDLSQSIWRCECCQDEWEERLGE